MAVTVPVVVLVSLVFAGFVVVMFVAVVVFVAVVRFAFRVFVVLFRLWISVGSGLGIGFGLWVWFLRFRLGFWSLRRGFWSLRRGMVRLGFALEGLVHLGQVGSVWGAGARCKAEAEGDERGFGTTRMNGHEGWAGWMVGGMELRGCPARTRGERGLVTLEVGDGCD
jgi:hypothetical protein